MNKKKYFL